MFAFLKKLPDLPQKLQVAGQLTTIASLDDSHTPPSLSLSQLSILSLQVSGEEVKITKIYINM